MHRHRKVCRFVLWFAVQCLFENSELIVRATRSGIDFTDSYSRTSASWHFLPGSFEGSEGSLLVPHFVPEARLGFEKAGFVGKSLMCLC